ncbi:SulP family inorganic anion transporter [Embleya scabrispora]|uniref:SulP family inorganic anion transporter n=1 Tax=Embleya scabrispora TaxID=159449 RepID=UPI00059428E3|nr:SulP family inorganic anion transporter [Embleya scabrispora]MYS85463.1 STAS domain-containing protein [Streptomyces sp. SID5474]
METFCRGWGRVAGLFPGPGDLVAVRRAPGRDLLAGLTVAVVALPLALAFGVASGVGAQAGLVTAVIAGALAAVFGGSDLQVSGPTGAMTVVLVPVVQRHGTDGVLMVGLLAGLLLVAVAVLRLGRAAKYLPLPVIEGFTAGIAVVIALQQVPAALGAAGEGEKVWQVAAHATVRFLEHPDADAPAMALGVAALLLIGARWRPGVPFSLLAVAAATLLAEALPTLDVARIGALPNGLPAPSLAFLDASMLVVLLPSALAVAALAGLESLLCASVADGMTTGQRHDPDRELFGQGLANLATPLFGGVPATAAIARTAVNVRAGASSRLAALTHAVVLAVIVFSAAGLVSHIPLPALAGVLLATCVRMVQVSTLTALARSTRADAAVLTVTFVVTVAVDLVTAVVIGIGLAVVLALRQVTRSARLEPVPLPTDETEPETETGAEAAAEHTRPHPHPRIAVFRLDGPLFFPAAHRLLTRLSEVQGVQVVVLRMSRVTAIDATGAGVLGEAITDLEVRGVTVLLSGVKPDHDHVLDALRIAEHLRRDHLVFPDTRGAIGHARELLRADRPDPAAH